MFKKKTVFIIGAGCSYEYGLPVGDGLKRVIIGYLKGVLDSRKRSAFHSGIDIVSSRSADDGQFLDAFNVLIGGDWSGNRARVISMIEGIDHALSIDRYLDFNRDDQGIVDIGKLAITRAILAAEGRSSLVLDGEGSLDTAEIRRVAEGGNRFGSGAHWIGELFSRLMDGGVERDAPEDAFANISFICFNYDRCIEHYLINALRAFGRYSVDQAAGAVRKLSIIHPYGQVGLLQWQTGEQPISAFGADVSNSHELIGLSKGIKLYTEQADSALVQTAHAQIQDAEQIIFMGFSFLEQNMNLLCPPGTSRAGHVFGTCFGESNQNVAVAKDMVHRVLSGQEALTPYGGKVELTNVANMTAGRFVADYGNMLRG